MLIIVNVKIKHPKLQMKEIWTRIFKISNMFSLHFPLTNMSIEHTHDWRLHHLVQISNCKEHFWWSLQTQNRVSLNFKLNTFKFQSIKFESLLKIYLNASSLKHLLIAEIVDHHFEHEFWHLQDQTQTMMFKFLKIEVNVLLTNTLRTRTKLILILTDTVWYDSCINFWCLRVNKTWKPTWNTWFKMVPFVTNI